jgi:uncharacterized membrane protein YdbT with pleckstrin-like domain
MRLRPGEQMLYRGRPSWRALFPFYAKGFALAIAVFAALRVADSTALAAIMGASLAAATLAIGYVRRLFTSYLITDQRLRVRSGMLRRKIQETRIARVQNVTYDQGLFDRLLDVGNVEFETAGADDGSIRFDWVDGPEEVVRAADEALSPPSH